MLRPDLRNQNSQESSSSNDNDSEMDYRCGVMSYRPDWLQRFATSRYYGLVFGLLGICQGTYRAYMVGTMSTVEKRFSISNRTSSVILIADDISPLLATLVFMLFLRRTSKPNWISGGMFLSLIGALSTFMPYSVFGAGTHLLGTAVPKSAVEQKKAVQFCFDVAGGLENCEARRQSDWSTAGAVAFMFVGNFLNGLGGVACYVIGTTYMDDNVKKKNSALYFGGIYVCRFIGPVIGLMLASACLSHYENPFVSPGITAKDPRWIGAWWIGYLVIGFGLFLSALPMLFFPKRIRSAANETRRDKAPASKPTLQSELTEAVQVLKRLARNPIYVFRTLGNIAVYIALTGYYISFPKYTQHQFQQTASNASLFTGPTIIMSNMVGTFLGALFVHHFQPRTRIIAWHNVVATVIAIGGVIALMGMSCGNLKYPLVDGSNANRSGRRVTLDQRRRVCARFEEASALRRARPRRLRPYQPDPEHPESERLRRSQERLRAFIPYPLIYGALMDASCLVWEDRCGGTGACWLYDLPRLRYLIHGVTTALLVVGCLFQTVVVYYSDRVTHFYDDKLSESDESNDVGKPLMGSKSRDENELKTLGRYATRDEAGSTRVST
ncbi:hypothetical protein HPB47_021758 [Ixodes persulcatus]|uniref:Uncharacterized protein n=1 Tax=Ixodes persulcatus TaxID=34615 RepID=A0AC60QBM4_IXOPE|nr:hypothetical protein HPB47_021758 [Ixodes persulcatus]